MRDTTGYSYVSKASMASQTKGKLCSPVSNDTFFYNKVVKVICSLKLTHCTSQVATEIVCNRSRK